MTCSPDKNNCDIWIWKIPGYFDNLGKYNMAVLWATILDFPNYETIIVYIKIEQKEVAWFCKASIYSNLLANLIKKDGKMSPNCA